MANYYVYVIELRGGGSHARPDVYVGSSAFPPSERFDKHFSSRRSSRHVRKRGVRLLPDLYRGLNPMSSREEAKAAEQSVRKRLERAGYRVYGSCKRDVLHGCWL